MNNGVSVKNAIEKILIQSGRIDVIIEYSSASLINKPKLKDVILPMHQVEESE